MEVTFYCDESGYTGPNWADPGQRVFVHGGWLVPSQVASAVKDEMEQLRRQHRLMAPELKSGQLQRRPDSSRLFRDFFQSALRQGCLPFFLIADKDYLIAAKAVETYFDPAYNHLLPMAFTSNAGRKKKIADGLMDAHALLLKFSDFLRAGVQPPAPEVRQLGRGIATHLRTVGQDWAAARLPEFTEEAVKDIQSEFDAAVWMRTTTGHTLWAVLQLLQSFLSTHATTASVIHDNVVRFDDLLDFVRGMFRPPSGPPIPLTDGRSVPSALPNLTSLELADSKHEPLLQLADLLCGHIRGIFTKLRDDIALSRAELATVVDLFAIKHEFDTWELNVPETLLVQFSAAAKLGISEGFPSEE